jgi:hypothetical protein
MTEQKANEQFYSYSCCAALHKDRGDCVWFGVRIDESGKEWARIAFVEEVPLEEITVYQKPAQEDNNAPLSDG